MNTLEIIFFILLSIVFYTYIGYGIVLYILVKIKETFRKPVHYPMPADEELPEVTLFIAAYNEEDVVDEKMQTTVPGLYAAGDCTGGLLQVAKAVYEGAQAGTEAAKALRKG